MIAMTTTYYDYCILFQRCLEIRDQPEYSRLIQAASKVHCYYYLSSDVSANSRDVKLVPYCMT